MSDIEARLTEAFRQHPREQIDALRDLLGSHARDAVSMHWLCGLRDETEIGEMQRRLGDSGDRAIVFLGPKDKLDATWRELEDGTRVFTLTIPPS